MRTTFHPILFALIPTLFILVNNLAEIDYRDIFLPLLVIVAISSALWFIVKIILKNIVKSALIISLGLVLFFLYGHYYNLVNEFAKQLGFGNHRYLLIPFIIAFVVGTIYLVRTRRPLNNANTIANVISLAIVSIILVNMVTFEFQNADVLLEKNNHVELMKPENPPDVYYIILDKYAGAITLKELFNYDNSEFLDFLKNRGFQIADESYSNYPNTRNSITSSLNMDYIHNLVDVPTNYTSKRPLNYLVANNEVMKNFKSLDYEIVTLDGGWTITKSFSIADRNLCSQEFVNYDVINQIFETSMLNPISVELSYDQVRESRLCVFAELSEIGARSEKPAFVFTHMILPHEPILFGENGEPINPDSLILKLDTGEGISAEYIAQLKFTNKKVQNAIDKILKSSETEPIIIIQSDHGYNSGIDWYYAYENDDPVMIAQAMRNFNAYHLPQEGRSAFYDDITPVNTFRLIFNEYFNGNYPLLENRMYFNTYDWPYSSKDVTPFIDKRN